MIIGDLNCLTYKQVHNFVLVVDLKNTKSGDYMQLPASRVIECYSLFSLITSTGANGNTIDQ